MTRSTTLIPSILGLSVCAFISSPVFAQTGQPAATTTAPAAGEDTQPGYDNPQPVTAEPKPKGAHADDGAYVNLSLGLGYGHVTAADIGSSVKLKGAGAGFGVIVGAPVVPNLILHGEATAFSITDPTVTSGGSSVRAQDANVLTFGIGPGFTYFTEPHGMYIGASTLASRTMLSVEGETLARSKWGLGGLARIGKEFAFQAVDLALGAQYQFADAADQANASGTVTSHSFSVSAGVTF